MTNLHHFPCAHDRIHFITSISLYQLFVATVNATKDHARALRDKTCSFGTALARHELVLEESFLWGWAHLSHLATGESRSLLLQSRMMLVLRYHNCYIELMKLACHLPANPKDPLTPLPATSAISVYAERGIQKASRAINLIATLNPSSFNKDYSRLLVPAIAFLMAYCKAAKVNPIAFVQLQKSLFRARQLLAASKKFPLPGATARPYLELLDFLTRHYSIPIHTPQN